MVTNKITRKKLFEDDGNVGGVNIKGRVPPQAVDVEKSVLGAMLIDKDAVPKVIKALSQSSFYNQTYRKFFVAMLSLYSKASPIDVVSVAAELTQLGQFNAHEDPVMLTELSMGVSSSANVEYHARILLEKGLMRELITSSSEILNRAYDDTEDPIELISEAYNKVQGLMAGFTGSDTVHISAGLPEVEKGIAKLMSGQIEKEDIRFGIRELDNITGGIEQDDYVVISGQEKSGKSSLAIQVAMGNAKRENAILFFSQEMSLKKLFLRMAIIDSGVNWVRALERKMGDGEWQRLGKSLSTISRLPIYVNDRVNTITTIRAGIESCQDKKIKLVIVDYLQIIDSESKDFQTREREVSEQSKQLKLLTKRMKIPIIVVSAVNEQGRARESRGIEYDMDKMVRIDREKDGKIDEERDIIETKIAIRQRMAMGGEMGDVKLGYHLKTGSWKSLSNLEEIPPSVQPDIFNPDRNHESRQENVF